MPNRAGCARVHVALVVLAVASSCGGTTGGGYAVDLGEPDDAADAPAVRGDGVDDAASAADGQPPGGGGGGFDAGGGGVGDAGGASPSKRVRVDPGVTDHAELVDTLAVGQSANNAERRVVLRLAAGAIPKLQIGDRLLVAAEVQVTTRCDVGQTAPGCSYDPKVSAQIIISGSPDDKDPAGAESKALSDVQTLTCNKSEHHCMFVFRPGQSGAKLENGFALPCVATDSCNINLVLWAWHADARAGGIDKVLVGGNEGDYLVNGKVDGDKGRLMIVRERGLDGADRHSDQTSGGGKISIPTNASPILIYSHQLKGGGKLEAGEQYVVEAELVAEVSGRARFSTLMFLTQDPSATDGGGSSKVHPKQIGEHNGINCTAQASPCVTRKVAVFRATDAIAGPVYVNIIAKSEVPGGGSASVSVDRNAGWLRATRYRAGIDG